MTVSRARLEALSRQVRSRRRVSAGDVPTPLNIVDFATNPNFLGCSLYPAQATVLKIVTLAIECLTPYDRDLIAGWEAGFNLRDGADGPRYEGAHGVRPGVELDMAWCQAQGWTSFREAVFVIGRRGSKNFLSEILMAWRLWQMLAYGDPQAHYGIPAGKPILIQVYGAKYEQAKRDAFGDIASLVRSAACFAPFLGRCTDNEVTLLTPAQLEKSARPGKDVGSLRVVVAATTTGSGRGAAINGLLLDEFAHLQGAGSTAESTDIYGRSAPPSPSFTWTH